MKKSEYIKQISRIIQLEYEDGDNLPSAKVFYNRCARKIYDKFRGGGTLNWCKLCGKKPTADFKLKKNTVSLCNKCAEEISKQWLGWEDLVDEKNTKG